MYQVLKNTYIALSMSCTLLGRWDEMYCTNLQVNLIEPNLLIQFKLLLVMVQNAKYYIHNFASARPLSKRNQQTNPTPKCGIQAVIKKFEESGEIKDKRKNGRPKKLWNYLWSVKFLKVSSLRDQKNFSKDLGQHLATWIGCHVDPSTAWKRSLIGEQGEKTEICRSSQRLQLRSMEKSVMEWSKHWHFLVQSSSICEEKNWSEVEERVVWIDGIMGAEKYKQVLIDHGIPLGKVWNVFFSAWQWSQAHC